MAPSIANDGTEAINCEACSDSSSDSHQYHPNRDDFCKHRHYTINLRFPVNPDLSMLTVLRLLRHASGAGWSRSNFSWGTFRCKRPNTLAASGGFDQRSMIALASSLILELRGGRFRKVSEPHTQNRRNPHARSARSIIARGRPLHLGLGPYEIQSPLGSGGMGEVYRSVACNYSQSSDRRRQMPRIWRLSYLTLLVISVYFCFTLRIGAQTSDSQPNDADKTWTATTESQSDNVNPTRTTESHSQHGNRTLDTQTVQRLGTDGHFEPYQDIEKETVKVDSTTVPTITRAFARDSGGGKTLVQVTEEESIPYPEATRT